MPKITKSRLLQSIPLFGFILSLLGFAVLYWAGPSPTTGAAFGIGPALLLFLVVIGVMHLQTAILLQCVTTAVWWQYGQGPYITVIAATLVGLKLGEWLGSAWKDAIDRAKTEEAGDTGNTARSAETDR